MARSHAVDSLGYRHVLTTAFRRAGWLYTKCGRALTVRATVADEVLSTCPRCSRLATI